MKDDEQLKKSILSLNSFNGFLKIPFDFTRKYNVTPVEAMILVFIDNATKNMKYGFWFKNYSILQALCNVSKSYVKRSITALLNKSLIGTKKVTTKNFKLVPVYYSLI